MMSEQRSCARKAVARVPLLAIGFLIALGGVLLGESRWATPATPGSYAFDNLSKTVDLDFCLRNWGPDTFEDGPMQQWWLDNYKIRLKMDAMPAGTYDQLLNARIAAKDIPDVWFTYNRSMMYKWASQGISIGDVEPLIKKYMPTYSKLLEATDMQTAMTSSKLMVAVPFRPSPIENVWMFRQDWLSKLKLTLPKNLDDIHSVATAFTKRDPDGNGQADTYGLIETGGYVLSGICASYGVMGNSGGANWQVRNGKLVWGLETTEYRQAMEWWANAVKEGIVHPDWSANPSWDQLSAIIANSKVGIWCGLSWWAADPDPGLSWVAVPNISGMAGGVAPQATPMTQKWMVLSKNLLRDEAKLKRVMIFLDQLMSAPNEGYIVTFSGVTRNGTPTLGGKIVTLADGNLAEDQANCWWFKKSMTYASVRDFDQSLDQVQQGKQVLQAQPARLKLMLPARTQTKGIDIVDPLFDVSATATLAPDQGKFVSATLMDFLTGKKPFTEWQAFVNTVMTRYKGNDMKAIYTKQLQDQGIAVQ